MADARVHRSVFETVYAKVPRLACQRRCQRSCVPISMTPFERARISTLTGRVPWTPSGHAACSLLDATGACGVYAVRPLICRLWGVVETMRCPVGCQPERWLTEAEAESLYRELLGAA
jgi:Fe-S-cluster containining protein